MLTQLMHKKETILFKNFIALLIESLTTDSQKQHLQDKHSGWISALAENRSQVPGLVKTKHEKKKIPQVLHHTKYPDHLLSSYSILILLKLLERKQLRNAATLMPCFPLTVISGMRIGK